MPMMAKVKISQNSSGLPNLCAYGGIVNLFLVDCDILHDFYDGKVADDMK